MTDNLNIESKAFRLNLNDAKKILKGLGIAMAGAGLTYLLGIVDAIDVDAYTPIWVAGASALINILQIWIKGQTGK